MKRLEEAEVRELRRKFTEDGMWPDSGVVALCDSWLFRTETLRQIAEVPDGPGWTSASAQRRIQAKARAALAFGEPES